MAADPAFERHLQWLLDGRPVAADHDVDAPSTAKAVRIVDAIARAHRTALFGTDESPDVSVTKRWGHLEIRDEIGRGASGTVYRAWDIRLAREVALKLWSSDAGHDAALEEGRLLARLNHPHIVRVFGADIHDGVAGIWMEMLEGDSLEEMLERDGVFGLVEALLIGIDLSSALAAVHAAGLLHRDVKARNVIRERGGRIVLMDLGAGRTTARADGSDGTGTPLYMAPEVLAGGDATERSDIYCLGVLLYRLLTGAYPVAAETVDELRTLHRSGERVRLESRLADLPSPVVVTVERACHPDPGARVASAADLEVALIATLRAVLTRVSVASPFVRRWKRWKSRAVVSSAVAATLLVGAWIAWDTHGGRTARRGFGLTVGPRSPLYVTLSGGVGIVRGRRLSLHPYNPSSASPIAVSADLGIRTMSGVPPWTAGANYLLDGSPVAGGSVPPAALCCFYDGTTDGAFNYAIRHESILTDMIGSRPLAPPALYQFDRDWSAPRELFPLSSDEGFYNGVTFAARSGTFWITRNRRDGGTIEQWSRQGQHLATPVTLVGASWRGIAIDPRDETLWVVRSENIASLRLENFDTSGSRLGSIELERPLVAMGIAGAEFAWVPAR